MLNTEQCLKALFAMSRIVGWCAHRIEEVMTSNKIIRPAYKTIASRLPYTPIAEREKIGGGNLIDEDFNGPRVEDVSL